MEYLRSSLADRAKCKRIQRYVKNLYAPLEPSFAKMRFLTQEAYEEGKIADAVDNFLKLSQRCKNDFSVFLSLGIIYNKRYVNFLF